MVDNSQLLIELIKFINQLDEDGPPSTAEETIAKRRLDELLDKAGLTRDGISNPELEP